jgi:predicted O-methyltransferase YrrM
MQRREHRGWPPPVTTRLTRSLRQLGILDTARLSADTFAREVLVDRWLHRFRRLSLIDVIRTGAQVCLDARAVLVASGFSAARVDAVVGEYAAIRGQLEQRRQLFAGRPQFPPECAVEDETALVLYALTRLREPELLLETGVANGHSSFVICRALAQNGHGRLVSIDIDPEAGALVLDEDRERWEFHALERGRLRDSLADVVRTLPAIDVFLHDSEHTYSWQMLEYGLVLPHLRTGGFVLTDDVESNTAYLDFCKREQLRQVILLGRGKALGLALPR